MLSRTSTLVLFVIAGTLAGFAVQRLRRAERAVSTVEAREEVARTLHDGVLQTLAIVQRRSGDDEVVRLARSQERELREYLFGSGVAAGGGDLGAGLRATAARVGERDGTDVRVVVAPDLPAVAPVVVDAICGAVGEACTNAAKHGDAGRIVVYVEPAEGALRCSVKDDGCGFDHEVVGEGFGITQSVRARIAVVGGTAEIHGNPGRGCEVLLSVPSLPLPGRSVTL